MKYLKPTEVQFPKYPYQQSTSRLFRICPFFKYFRDCEYCTKLLSMPRIRRSLNRAADVYLQAISNHPARSYVWPSKTNCKVQKLWRVTGCEELDPKDGSSLKFINYEKMEKRAALIIQVPPLVGRYLYYRVLGRRSYCLDQVQIIG